MINIELAHDRECKRLTFTDTTVYGYGDNPKAQDVSLRNMIIYDACAGTIVSCGQAKQQYCLALKGDAKPGDVITLKIGLCTVTYTVTEADIFKPDARRAEIKFVIYHTFGANRPVNFFFVENGNVIDIVLGATERETAANIAATMTLFHKNRNEDIVYTAAGSVITVSVSPTWYKTEYDQDINGVVWNVTSAYIGGPGVPVECRNTQNTFSGGQINVPNNVTPTAANIYSSIVRTYKDQVRLPETPFSGCAVAPTADCDDKRCKAEWDMVVSCNESCNGILVTSRLPGVPFYIEAKTSTATISIQKTILKYAEQNMANPGANVVNSIEIAYKNDTIYCARLTIQSGAELIERCICFAAMCHLQCVHNKTLTREIECCTTNCLSETTRIRNMIESIKTFACDGDFASACKTLKMAQQI